MIDILGDALRAIVSTETAIFIVVAVSLNLQYGYAGLLNFGQVGYLMMGGYGVAITVSILGASFGWESWPPWQVRCCSPC